VSGLCNIIKGVRLPTTGSTITFNLGADNNVLCDSIIGSVAAGTGQVVGNLYESLPAGNARYGVGGAPGSNELIA